MYQIAEGIRGIHILGVFQDRGSLDMLLSRCTINPRSRYVLMEVGMEKETVQDVLTGLGVRGTLTGAQYLHEAVTIGLDDCEAIERITKLMYPRIAKMHDTTPGRVERAMRVAIEKSWQEADPEFRKIVFGPLGMPGCGRPTNTEYIEMVVNYLK